MKYLRVQVILHIEDPEGEMTLHEAISYIEKANSKSVRVIVERIDELESTF